MATKKKSTWVRGVNITVSPEAHSRLSEYAFLFRKNLRQVLDELAAKIELPSR